MGFIGCAKDHTSSQLQVSGSQLSGWPYRAYEAVDNAAELRSFVENFLSVIGAYMVKILSNDQLSFDFN
jgi:hypothetical protein